MNIMRRHNNRYTCGHIIPGTVHPEYKICSICLKGSLIQDGEQEVEQDEMHRRSKAALAAAGLVDLSEADKDSGKYDAYFKDVRHLERIDAYRTVQLFGCEQHGHAIGHAAKKLLLTGVRTGGKDVEQEVQEAIDSLIRWQDMRREDKSAQEPKEWDGEEWPIPAGATVKNWLGERRTVVGYDRDRDVCILRFEDEPEDYIAYTRAKAMGNLIRPINASAERDREETIDAARETLTTTFGVTDLTDDVELVLSTLYNVGLLRKQEGKSRERQ